MATQGATSGYAAGEQTNAMPLLYAQEANAGTPPGGAWQKLRYTGESLAVQDTTATPDEINDNAEDAETVLTGRATSGNVNGVLSNGTFDDFFAGVMCADWSGTGPTITLSAVGTMQVRSCGGVDFDVIWDHGKGLFAGWPTSGIVRITCASPAIDYTVPYTSLDAKATSLNLAKNALDPIRPQLAQIGGVTNITQNTDLPTDMPVGTQFSTVNIMNGKVNKTFSFCKPLAGQSQIFTMNFVNQLQISMQRGQTPTVQIDLTGSDMQITTASPVASVTPANNSPIMDVVAGFKGLTIFGNTPAGCVQSATLTLKRNNSGQDTGMGHVGACGVQFGSFAVTLDVEYFFKDWQQFTDWQAGKKGPVTLSIVGADGYGYTFTILNARIFNPGNPSDGKNKTIVAKLSIVGNPAAGGGTLAITRITPN